MTNIRLYYISFSLKIAHALAEVLEVGVVEVHEGVIDPSDPLEVFDLNIIRMYTNTN